MTELGIRSLAPILVVESIEACLPFWVHRLGFTVTVTVPENAPLAFAIITQGGLEIMLQARASAGEDLGDIGAFGPSIIYISVPTLDPVLAAILPQEIAVARRTTFYGADEIYVRDPAGNVVGFSAPSAAAA